MIKRKTNGKKDDVWYCDYCEEYHSEDKTLHTDGDKQFCGKWIYYHKEEE